MLTSRDDAENTAFILPLSSHLKMNDTIPYSLVIVSLLFPSFTYFKDVLFSFQDLISFSIFYFGPNFFLCSFSCYNMCRSFDTVPQDTEALQFIF